MATKRQTHGKRIFSLEMPLYDSMEQMSGATKIPMRWLKLAKREGCMFVSHNRCSLSVFIEWFFTRESDGEEEIDWGKREKRAKALMSEANLERERETVVDFETTKRFLIYLTDVAFYGELDRMAHEFPASLKGKSENEINDEVEKQVERVKKSISSSLDTFVKNKGKV